MSEEFTKGKEIPLTNGNKVSVVKKLGEGGQGVVYQVSLNGKTYALKWYHQNALKDPDCFYSNLKSNVDKGSPAKSFIWPLYLTQPYENSFGYVMDLRPNGYYEFSDFLLAKVHFASLSAVINAALNITNGFRELHRAGYSYQDLNDGNFFINPQSGDVLICDNDNVAPYGESLGIAGKARYMAPEVVRNISRPDGFSDRFSLSVILFRLLFLDHPLEGRNIVSAPCMTEALELRYYGTNPVFIYDQADSSNRPVPSIHRNVERFWNLYPKFVRECFLRAFSAEAMNADDMEKVRQTRLMDNDWQSLFVKLRSHIVTCSCGGETFIDCENDTRCINCGATIQKPYVLQCPNKKYIVPLFPGCKIYRCNVDVSSDDYSSLCGEVTRHPTKPGIWGIRNLDKNIWKIKMDDGSEATLEPGKNIPFGKVKSICFDSKSEGIITK